MNHTSLFSTRIDESRVHPQFRSLRNSPLHADARQLMDDLYNRMGDPNGNFVSFFQAANFHSRLFELACFAYLESAGLSIDHSYDKPDFIVSNGQYDLAIEAVTANPSENQRADISIQALRPEDQNEITNKVTKEFPKRMGRLLRKKLSKRYHELPQCENKPIILMVAPFFEPGATTYTDDALIPYLYGEPDGWSEDMIPFFMDPSSSTISAIAYCNSFTVPKFFRLATDISNHDEMYAIREGTCYVDYSDTENALRQFSYQVGSPGSPVETWSEGVTIFKNPLAKSPLPDNALPATSIISVENGFVSREVLGFHPVTSFMIVHIKGQT